MGYDFPRRFPRRLIYFGHRLSIHNDAESMLEIFEFWRLKPIMLKCLTISECYDLNYIASTNVRLQTIDAENATSAHRVCTRLPSTRIRYNVSKL